MNKMARICLLGLGLALLVVSVATAQENFKVGGVAGVRGLAGHAILPPAKALFTNCGPGCTSYNTGSGYYICGTSCPDSPGQTLAMGFSATKATTFVKALGANTNYISVAGKIGAYLLKGDPTAGPTTKLAKLVQHGTIPDFPTIATIKYTLKKGAKPVSFKKGKTYFFCQTEPTAGAEMLWMVSNSDLSSPFWFQEAGTCINPAGGWLNATGAANGAALEIN